MSHGRLPARRLSLATIAAALIAASAPAIAQMGPGPGRDDRGFERGPGMDRGGRFERDGRRGRGEETIMGFSRERLARIAPVMREQVDRGMFPGAVTLIARRGRIIHFEAHGFRDAAKTQPMTRDTLFMLASRRFIHYAGATA